MAIYGAAMAIFGGLAATDERLVPYGAMTAMCFTGLGCLAGPSLASLVVRSIAG